MKPEQVVKTASALYNHCRKDECKTCPFAIRRGGLIGCPLYQQPINWQDDIANARKALKEVSHD
jgi:hypothetical protein